jgi:hypothetical protein
MGENWSPFGFLLQPCPILAYKCTRGQAVHHYMVGAGDFTSENDFTTCLITTAQEFSDNNNFSGLDFQV